MTDKITLRRDLRATRAAFVAQLNAAQRRKLETDLAANLLAHIGNMSGKVVASYAALGDEIGPGLIDQRIALACGTTLYPRVSADQLTLTFHHCAATELQPGYKAILEPAVTMPQLRPDIVLVPLVGVDRSGNRIGQGAGHYDRALHVLRLSLASYPPVLAIGLAWDVQLIDNAATDPWDQPLDALITPSGCLGFSA